MASSVQIRVLLEGIRGLAAGLTDKEVSDIGRILFKAAERMEKESLGE